MVRVISYYNTQYCVVQADAMSTSLYSPFVYCYCILSYTHTHTTD